MIIMRDGDGGGDIKEWEKERERGKLRWLHGVDTWCMVWVRGGLPCHAAHRLVASDDAWISLLFFLWITVLEVVLLVMCI